MAHPNSHKGRLEIALRQVRDIVELHKFRQRVCRDPELGFMSLLELDRLAYDHGVSLRHSLDPGLSTHLLTPRRSTGQFGSRLVDTR